MSLKIKFYFKNLQLAPAPTAQKSVIMYPANNKNLTKQSSKENCYQIPTSSKPRALGQAVPFGEASVNQPQLKLGRSVSGKSFSSALASKPVLALEQQQSCGFDPTENTQSSESPINETSLNQKESDSATVKICANLGANVKPIRKDRRTKHPKFKVHWTEEEVSRASQFSHR